MEGFLDATSDIPGDTPVIMHGQNPYTVAGIAGVLLGEELLHGYDIATAIGRPWPLDPADTQLVLAAYAPALGFLLNPETTRGLSAGFGIELRGVGEMTVRFTDGVFGLEEAGAGPVDATISADPVAFLMVGTGRLSRYQAIALGLLSVGGNRPRPGDRLLGPLPVPEDALTGLRVCKRERKCAVKMVGFRVPMA